MPIQMLKRPAKWVGVKQPAVFELYGTYFPYYTNKTLGNDAPGYPTLYSVDVPGSVSSVNIGDIVDISECAAQPDLVGLHKVIAVVNGATRYLVIDQPYVADRSILVNARITHKASVGIYRRNNMNAANDFTPTTSFYFIPDQQTGKITIDVSEHLALMFSIKPPVPGVDINMYTQYDVRAIIRNASVSFVDPEGQYAINAAVSEDDLVPYYLSDPPLALTDTGVIKQGDSKVLYSVITTQLIDGGISVPCVKNIII